MKGSSYVKFPSRSSTILNIENDDRNCLVWSNLAELLPCNISQPNRVSNYRIYFNDLNIDGFEFTNGFMCNDVPRFEKLNNLSLKIFELSLYQDQNKQRHKLIPLEIFESKSDRVVDLLIYKNHYVLIEKLIVFLGNHNCIFVCRRCFSSYTKQNVLSKHNQRCEQQKLTSNKISNESYIF